MNIDDFQTVLEWHTGSKEKPQVMTLKEAHKRYRSDKMRLYHVICPHCHRENTPSGYSEDKHTCARCMQIIDSNLLTSKIEYYDL
jgi:uncharacterized CHY-type Zn-finger protein